MLEKTYTYWLKRILYFMGGKVCVTTDRRKKAEQIINNCIPQSTSWSDILNKKKSSVAAI